MINVKLELNKKIYTKNTVLSAVKAYNTLAKIQIFESAEYWICTFDKCIYDIGLTKYEFENYCIDLMNASTDENP